MKAIYPIILTEDSGMYVVDIPDLKIGTQGKDIADAIYMARDAIGAVGMSYEDEGKEIPLPNGVIPSAKDGQIVTLVDIDFDDYRRRSDTRAVRKNCTIPAWLNDVAVKQNINFSQVLQEALKQQLGV